MRQKSQLFSGFCKSIRWNGILSKVIQYCCIVSARCQFSSSLRVRNRFAHAKLSTRKMRVSLNGVNHECWFLLLIHSSGEIIKSKCSLFLNFFTFCNVYSDGIRIFFCFHFRMQSVSTCSRKPEKKKLGAIEWREERRLSSLPNETKCFANSWI